MQAAFRKLYYEKKVRESRVLSQQYPTVYCRFHSCFMCKINMVHRISNQLSIIFIWAGVVSSFLTSQQRRGGEGGGGRKAT